LPKAVAAFIEQYGFLRDPTAEELRIAAVDATKPLTFQRGRLEVGNKLIAIDYVQIFGSGFSAATHTNTNESDLVLNHIMDWAQAHFKFEFEDVKPGIGHSSVLEVRLQKALPTLLPMLSIIGEMVATSLDDWWSIRPSYELTTVNFSFDRTKYPQLAPPAFRLERRENVPFGQGAYYTEAPMKTENHIAVLTRLEQLCLEALENGKGW
jgi:hypothetical protein